jgi:hypothetical protein
MQTFQDMKGRDWNIVLSLYLANRIKSKCKVDLTTTNDKPDLFKLETDAIAFGEVLWQIVESQAQAANVSQDDFLAAMGGSELGSAWDAFREAYIAFQPSYMRENVRRALDKQEHAITSGMTMLAEQIDGMDIVGDVRKALDKAMAAYSAG